MELVRNKESTYLISKFQKLFQWSSVQAGQKSKTKFWTRNGLAYLWEVNISLFTRRINMKKLCLRLKMRDMNMINSSSWPETQVKLFNQSMKKSGQENLIKSRHLMNVDQRLKLGNWDGYCICMTLKNKRVPLKTT